MGSDPHEVVRVFVVDDHELVRRGLVGLLRGERGFEIVGEASTVREALELIGCASPDVVVLDVRLPDGNGIEICRSLRKQLPAVRWLFLTAYDDEESLQAAIAAGASGYLYKHTFGDELISALRTVGSGGSLVDAARAHRVLERLRLRKAAEEHDRRTG